MLTSVDEATKGGEGRDGRRLAIVDDALDARRAGEFGALGREGVLRFSGSHFFRRAVDGRVGVRVNAGNAGGRPSRKGSYKVHHAI